MGTTLDAHYNAFTDCSTEELRLIALAAFGNSLNFIPRDILVDFLALNASNIFL